PAIRQAPGGGQGGASNNWITGPGGSVTLPGGGEASVQSGIGPGGISVGISAGIQDIGTAHLSGTVDPGGVSGLEYQLQFSDVQVWGGIQDGESSVNLSGNIGDDLTFTAGWSEDVGAHGSLQLSIEEFSIEAGVDE